MPNDTNDHLPIDENVEMEKEMKSAYKNYKKLKELGVDRWTRILLRIAPAYGVKRLTRSFGGNFDYAEKAHALFDKTERIDIIPSCSGTRGFQIILDKSTALYFNQDGDHFTYDGFEVGEYDGGEVTVFDGKTDNRTDGNTDSTDELNNPLTSQ